MKKILKYIVMWIIALALSTAIWHFGNMYGYVYAVITILGILSYLIPTKISRNHVPPEVVAIALIFIPLMVLVAISIIFSGNETFRMIESGSVVTLLLLSMASITVDEMAKAGQEAQKRKREEELKTTLEEEKKLYKFEENIIKKELNIDLIKLYQESSEVKNRFVGSVLMEGNFSINYIYLIDTCLLKMIIQNNNNYYEYKIDKKITQENNVSTLLIARIIKEFITQVLKMPYRPLIKKQKGVAHSNFWLDDAHSWVSKNKLYYNQATIDEIVITKDQKTSQYGLLFVNRFFAPAGLSFPISGDTVSVREMNDWVSNTVSDIENLQVALGSEFQATKLKELEGSYQGFELRGSIDSKITLWYHEDKDVNNHTLTHNMYDTLSNIFIPMKNLQELLEDNCDKAQGLRLISHQKEILKMLINVSKTDSVLKEYFKEA